jgi:hypothetical protein
MISLPTLNYTVVEDTNIDAHIDQRDVNITLTFAEHEMMMDVLRLSIDVMDFSCFHGMFNLPIDSEILQRYTMIENLRERFNTAWHDRFNTDND